MFSMQEAGGMEHSAFGQWLGWFMAAIYMGGRIPQIWLNVSPLHRLNIVTFNLIDEPVPIFPGVVLLLIYDLILSLIRLKEGV